MPKPFRYLEPTFFAGLFDDPLLLIRIRPTGRAILFDCGKMHHLAKRVYTSIDAIFISHAHMDHFMGMDSVIRHSHASPRTIDVFGPPGLAERMASKFACYDWNLADTFWGNFRVNEVGDEGRVASTLYKGAEAFAAVSEGERNGILYGNRYLAVTAARCEHRIPVMAYRVDEGSAFVVDEARMAAEGIRKGAWLKGLERLFRDGAMEGSPIRCPAGDGGMEERWEPDAAALYRRIRRVEEPASIGYVTDVGYSPENLGRLAELLKGVTLLVCECAFLASQQKKAQLSRHLCTAEFNVLLDRLRPRFVLPMHFSKTNQRGSAPLYEEIEPPPGTTVLKIPDRLTPRPIMESEVPRPVGM